MTTQNGTTSKRLFIACPIRDPAVELALADAWKQLIAHLPADPEPRREPEPHLTLRFLGDVDLSGEDGQTNIEVLSLVLDIQAKHIRQMPLFLGPIGAFPGVVWAGVGGTVEGLTELNVLQQRVGHIVEGLGFPKADFPYWPHITLGRCDRDATSSLTEMLATLDYPPQGLC